MSRLANCFQDLAAAGKQALIPYIAAGDPEPAVTVPMMHAMVRAGANIIELGVPFSDPMADGPVIQAACERALAHGVTLKNVLDMVRTFRQTDQTTPVVLMGYLNPVEVMGYQAFADAARDAGVDGVLTVDLPPEEGGEFVRTIKGAGLDPVFLLAPTSTPQRIEQICAAASGFVYYVSLKGVTGAANLDLGSVADKVKQIREATDLPIGVGFGIKDAQSAADVAGLADAVVVGSAIVRQFAEHAGDPAAIEKNVTALLHDMRQAMDKNAGD
jgi:tryptophan synthase alpha chain